MTGYRQRCRIYGACNQADRWGGQPPITAHGPINITLAEFAIESFFPANAATKAALPRPSSQVTL